MTSGMLKRKSIDRPDRTGLHAIATETEIIDEMIEGIMMGPVAMKVGRTIAPERKAESGVGMVDHGTLMRRDEIVRAGIDSINGSRCLNSCLLGISTLLRISA